ncbi:MAG TPA: ATP-binding cassette domain-containing protein [Candidatus Thiothrix moscowensis]|uniref:ATP-binding cassette domain-containing protein n=1 Tax=unclassified Thiothrix TaxID=2636184 RepID=UPI0025DBE651|nr:MULTISPECIES: ATP-binding cassette domain-containing protein [unclassified Thiothrix]HRJ51540.1 ATP-binding cassette domain-containing protein [Candidatus Thiothrix moscowensis]HRJ91855.1 ATP-binding cassette domain-containing protein [Candidatus Thiothrix moscowensis]
MLVFSDLTLRRGAKALLESTSFSIHPGQKAGVTGANGVGKSTLFALIRGEISQDTGNFSMPPGWVIAHVKQETPSSQQSALHYALEGDTEYVSLHAQLEHADGAHLGELHARLDAIDGYTAESRAATLLHGLGFKPEEITRPVSSFSGGWRMRLNLAQALMCRSDLLLLDEPTNHLDLDAVIWLQDWLNSYRGTLLLISHDREFLDAICTNIAHIEHGRLTLYTGNYSTFEITRAEKLAQQQSAYEKQKREREHMQKYVDRFRAQATKARQAQSRLKALERMEVISAAHVDSPFHFSFRDPEKLPDRLLHVREARLGYADKTIIDKVELQIFPSDRIGLIGPNGAGKSTLIKFLAGKLPAQAGESWQAPDLKIGYFAQHQLEQLKPDQSPLQHLRELDKQAREQDLRNFLGGFAFQGTRVEEAVAPFSGGEKARLALALLIYQRPNLLLLDEPTNHLDLDMRLALSMALQAFKGAMLIVSHDRHMLKTVTDKLLLVDSGKAVEFDGDLDDYAVWLQNRFRAEEAAAKPSDEPAAAHTSAGRKDQRRESAERRKQLQPLKRKVEKLEQEMDKLNQQKAVLETQLADPDIYNEANKNRLKQLLLDKSNTDAKLEEVEMAWMEASEAYETASAAGE